MTVSPVLIGNSRRVDLDQSITAIKIEYSMTAVSQITVSLEDPKFRMLNAGYFQIRMPVTYMNENFEISSVEIMPGTLNEQVVLECRAAGIQQMKRDKGQFSWGNVSASNFAEMMAKQFGLQFFGQPAISKKAITRTRNNTTDESSWDVILRLAGELHFEAFESMGILFFTSQDFLFGKYGEGINLYYPYPEGTPNLQVMGVPDCRSSDDDPKGATYNASIYRTGATSLRPGMTFAAHGVGPFSVSYLIADVTYDEMMTTPVAIQAQTPVNPNIRVV